MLEPIDRTGGKSFALDPITRGYHVAYRENEVNHCPGCGRTHWYVGRLSAECGFCGTALPLSEATMRGTRAVAGLHWPPPAANAV